MDAASTIDLIRGKGVVPRHVAVIMDGNGRWARERGLPRRFGHSNGIKAVREVVAGSIEAGIQVLTLFAFSTDNWKRPRHEVTALMELLRRYAEREREELLSRGVEVRILGELDRVEGRAREAVQTVVDATRGGERLLLNLMISYGGREELVRAARLVAERVERGEINAAQVDSDAFATGLFTCGLPDPDLLIRTSGEYRLSNFLLWQLAYTEIHISPVLWPDFRREHLFGALLDYQGRERRFGKVRT